MFDLRSIVLSRNSSRALLAALWVAAVGCGGDADEVVVYTSLDQVFSEPVLRAWEASSGVRVRAVYDTEAAKTTGLVNRLLAERARPRADVFWNSEIAQMLRLAEAGVLAPYASPGAEDVPPALRDPEALWTGFAARARVLIYDRRQLDEDSVPRSIFELTEPRWRGRVCIAYPMFGTTATHAAALFATLGPDRAEAYYRALLANDVRVVDGNATTRDLVVSGAMAVGFTDTDDALVAIERGDPVGIVFPDADGIGTLVIPNTVGLVADGPNPAVGRRLIDHLLSHEVEAALARSGSGQMPVREGIPGPLRLEGVGELRPMEVAAGDIAEHFEPAMTVLGELFAR